MKLASVPTNKNTEWLNQKAAWLAYAILIFLCWLVTASWTDPGMAWTYVHLGHGAITYYLLHWNKGSPIQDDQGIYDRWGEGGKVEGQEGSCAAAHRLGGAAVTRSQPPSAIAAVHDASLSAPSAAVGLSALQLGARPRPMLSGCRRSLQFPAQLLLPRSVLASLTLTPRTFAFCSTACYLRLPFLPPAA
mgnify:CR=1 FL=1